ncbi:MAG: TfoX/Sxy family protein [bacterium]
MLAFDVGLAERLREIFQDQPNVREKKMFGGLAFMVNGNMCCGIVSETLMLRVGAEQYDEALARPHARKMAFTGKPMKGMIYVDPDGFAEDADLQDWVQRGLNFVQALPPK